MPGKSDIFWHEGILQPVSSKTLLDGLIGMWQSSRWMQSKQKRMVTRQSSQSGLLELNLDR